MSGILLSLSLSLSCVSELQGNSVASFPRPRTFFSQCSFDSFFVLSRSFPHSIGGGGGGGCRLQTPSICFPCFPVIISESRTFVTPHEILKGYVRGSGISVISLVNFFLQIGCVPPMKAICAQNSPNISQHNYVLTQVTHHV